MDLTLTGPEADLLRRILRGYLSDLRMEIADTDSYDLRQSLEQDEESIKRLLAGLEHRSAAA